MENTFYTKPFGKKDDDEDPLSDSASEAEYTFEGYSIEFNDKIVLTPVSAGK